MSENTPLDPERVSRPDLPPLPAQSAADAAAATPVYAQQHPYVAPSAPAGASTYPTLPVGATAQWAPAPRPARVGAGTVAGIMIAAALVGGAAGIGGAAAGAALFSSPTVISAGEGGAVVVNNKDGVTQTTAIAAKVLPSVVTIAASGGSGGGTGSGVILTADGYVVTNAHVVTLDGATGDAALTVTTSDGRVFQAEIVGTDPIYDLAVIKLVGAEDLTPIEFADSAALNVGDTTIAVGAPLGLSNTVTTGIVSALNRSIQIASSEAPETPQGGDDEEGEGSSPFQFDFGPGHGSGGGQGSISIAVIQTDAAINPGNSGGALVDADGKLIGINVAIATAGGSSSEAGSIGVGFSIPSNIVERITQEIIDDGAATHGLLGAMVGNAAAQEGATTAGALISEVTAGGAADAAGLRKGDIVTSFEGVPIMDATDLTAQVRALAGGSSAELTYLRDGKKQTATVELGTLAP